MTTLWTIRTEYVRGYGGREYPLAFTVVCWLCDSLMGADVVRLARYSLACHAGANHVLTAHPAQAPLI